jgi:photosystem II stability/assembly factor-like uncharacterized protein
MRLFFRPGRLALVAAIVSAAPLVAADTLCQIQDSATRSGRVFLLCGAGRIFVSGDQGKAWQIINLPPDVRFRAMAFQDDRRVFIVGDAGTLLASQDGGRTWTKAAVQTEENLTDITFVGDSGWISGQLGVILYSADAGRTWNKQVTNVVQGLASVYFRDALHGWAVGWVGTIIRTDDGGKTWKRLDIGDASWSLTSVYFRDEKNGWITGMFGQLLRTRDGGATWKLENLPTKAVLTRVFFDSAGRGYATLENDILFSKDGGDTWTPLGIEQWLFLKHLMPVGNTLWAVGTFHILVRDSDPTEWTRLTTTPSNQFFDKLPTAEDFPDLSLEATAAAEEKEEKQEQSKAPEAKEGESK